MHYLRPRLNTTQASDEIKAAKATYSDILDCVVEGDHAVLVLNFECFVQLK
jgi:hypothetical protein